MLKMMQLEIKKKRVLQLKITRGEGRREGIVRKFGIDMYPLLYLKRITNKDLLYIIGNSAQYYITTQVRKEFKKSINTCICITGVTLLFT